MDLKETIEQALKQFTQTILETMKRSSIAELGEIGMLNGAGRGPSLVRALPSDRGEAPRGRPIRMPRRTQAQIDRTIGKIVELLKEGEGMRAETIRENLNLDRRALPRVLQDGISQGVLRKKGEKRATVYSLKVTEKAPKTEASPRKAAKKSSKRGGR